MKKAVLLAIMASALLFGDGDVKKVVAGKVTTSNAVNEHIASSAQRLTEFTFKSKCFASNSAISLYIVAEKQPDGSVLLRSGSSKFDCY